VCVQEELRTPTNGSSEARDTPVRVLLSMRPVMEKLVRAAALLALSATCNASTPALPADASAEAAADPPSVDSPPARVLRERLVASLVADGDLRDSRVVDAMRRVPRHAFVPDAPLRQAYGNFPLPIGFEQTISQPAVVAIMTEALELSGRESTLEVGTGSGYQAAILGLLSREVFTIEIVPELARQASRRLRELGYANVHVRAGDGYHGWPEHAPFDRILVTAAPPVVPQTLLDQLKDGGVLVAPVGPGPRAQTLLRYRRHQGRFDVDDLGAVVFVPMVPSEPDAAAPPPPGR
jgi:protein-L-isoaspartate(D-aspartate) O-methyltransferase